MVHFEHSLKVLQSARAYVIGEDEFTIVRYLVSGPSCYVGLCEHIKVL